MIFDYRPIILCGGKATRMGDLCATKPKAMLKIGNLSILARQLLMLPDTFVKPILCTGDSPFQKEFRDIADTFQCEIVANEYEQTDGTGGAIWQAIRKWGVSTSRDNTPLLVLNGDVIFEENLTEMLIYYLERESAFKHIILGAGLYPVKDYGQLIVKDNRVSEFKEKQDSIELDYINAGCYILHADDYLAYSSESCSIERDVFPKLCADNKVGVYKTTKFWSDLGTPDRLEEARKVLACR